ncbi:MAG TPA: hypothetical protein VEV82_08085, partial [Actinomycetota bacterium]|nr:hypothetical protein [Actinomycetota bacterium]
MKGRSFQRWSSADRGPSSIKTLLLIPLLIVSALVSPASAGDCTTNWDGGAATDAWEDDQNWSGDVEPGEGVAINDFACIPAATDVELSSTRNVLGVVVNGSLTVKSPGALFIHNGAPSSIADFTLDAATLGGPGTVTITDTFDWTSRTDGASTQTTRPLNE